MSTAVVWFRRDLRLSDNPTLRAALDAADEVVPLFVVDPRLWEPASANRRWFLVGCLDDLDEQLGGGLVVRRGDPVDVVPQLARQVGAEVVFHAGDVGPYGRERDERVASALADDGRRVEVPDTPWVVAPGDLSTTQGGTYKVFTPFFRAWKERGAPDPRNTPRRIPVASGVRSDGVPRAPSVDADLPTPGETAGRRRANRFLREDVDDYDERRDDTAADATSRLSPYLKYGCIHPRQLLGGLDLRNRGHATFAQELAWRDFYAHVLHEWPDSAWSAWSDTLKGISVSRGTQADEHFEAWCEGRTGYPFVDAGMRQLVAEGWMHNRARMTTASFLVKDLHIDWTRGARFFLRHLVDGDLSSNNHGWQWVAGTGTDAAPYFRIFNPVRQSKRFDRDGGYIRRWVPELADVEGSAVHEPWTLDGGPPDGYPEPIVDHAAERDEALRRYEAATGRS